MRNEVLRGPGFQQLLRHQQHAAHALPPPSCREAALAGRNIFLTGVGGVGKSHLIRHLLRHWEEHGASVAVCALTGCAASLLGVGTLHSVLKWR